MNRKLKKALKSAFDAPKPANKAEFLNSLPYPKATNTEFFLSQVGYIRKRFWCLSLLILMGLFCLSGRFPAGKESVGLLSASLPLLTLLGITEISKSTSYHMSELEMSCKYNLAGITLIRFTVISVVQVVMLLLLLLMFKHQSQYGMFRYALYAVTPFLLSSYLSIWVTNHLKSKDTLYICGGVTALISMAVFMMNVNVAVIYRGSYTPFWSMACLAITGLLVKEIYHLLTERNEEWNFA